MAREGSHTGLFFFSTATVRLVSFAENFPSVPLLPAAPLSDIDPLKAILLP